MSQRSAPYPLTRSQQLIWTGQQLQPSEPLYNMALSFRIQGDLDTAAFERAFALLLQQADALRITFGERDGVVHQYVNDALEYTVETVDLTTADAPEIALSNWQSARAQQQFDLSRCLFDSCLIKMGQSDHVWFFNQHHLTTDAWSTAVLYRQMSQLYTAEISGTQDDVASLPAFVDYIEKEQASRHSKSAVRADTFWSEALKQPFEPSSFYRATPAERTGRTHRFACDFGAQRTRQLEQLVAAPPFAAITPELARFQYFATVYFAWLHRLGGEQHLSIGTPSHNRSAATLKRTPGMFIEVFPLQVTISDGESFTSLYKKVALATRNLLLNAPAGTTSHAHHRAYDVVLNVITAQYGDFAGHDMTSTWVHADHGDRGHLVRIQVEDFDRADALRVHLDLHEDVFVGDDVERARRDFLTLNDAMLKSPEQQIARVSLIDDAGTAHKLALGASQATTPPPERTVVELIDEQARSAPDATALFLGAQTMSYHALAACSQTLAETLEQHGVQRGDRVALALPRSRRAVIAMLAIQRLGAAYVPIDIAYPAQRIQLMLEDAEPRLVVTDPALNIALPANVTQYALTNIPTPGDAELTSRATLEDIAYIIYTSGSTGRPKGVEVRHAGLANYATWAARAYHDGAAAGWPLFSSLAFDLTVTSIFAPLIDGGCLVIYPENQDSDGLAIRDVIEDNRVDVIKLTPAHLSLILPMDLSASKVRTLIVGGEDFKVSLARAVSRQFDDKVTLYNEYGPTEATVACMIHRFDPTQNTGLSVPIGRAIDHAHIYVVDAAGQLMPRGAIGEIAIGGVGVARGYRQRDGLNAERFCPNPFRDGEILYRTGDLARWRDDGALAYHGRRDDQVKVNGVRVELGDIEAALAAVPGVTAAAARLTVTEETAEETFCQRCGLSGRHPNARLDNDLVCHICRVYHDERERALKYFGSLDDLQRIVDSVIKNAPNKPDSMMLLSGGKDSTFALCQLVDMGLTPLVFTLDNGFISEGAKANMRRVTDKLGLELIVGSTPAMNEIFVDSLRRFSNVCNGCFKTIYTLSVQLARQRGIRHIFTGLSRGQVFETRVADQFTQRIFDPAQIDQNVIEARKAYHRADDAVSRNMDVSVFENDDIFDEIQYVDFYRYTDVSLDEMLNYLAHRVPWVRPADTGRSTNCLINEAGIFVHKAERGFHNYSLPYSWDVRLGHKQRDAAREELDDHINVDNVRAILDEIGYEMPDGKQTPGAHRQLIGYYTGEQDVDLAVLRARLTKTLPSAVVPTQFVRIEALPLTQNGKLDRAALPDPDALRPALDVEYEAPDGVVERNLAAIWQQVLGVDRVGANDNFFDLGGDSILNIQIVGRARKHGLTLKPQQIFEHATVRQLARVVGDTEQVLSEQGSIEGPVALNPIQSRFFERHATNPDHCNQNVVLCATGNINALMLEESLRHVLHHHDALRAKYEHVDNGWQQVLLAPEQVSVKLDRRDISSVPAASHDIELESIIAEANKQLCLARGELVHAVLVERGDALPPWLVIVVHHLAIDGVSWWILLEDLQNTYGQLHDAHPVSLPPKTTSVRRFTAALTDYANSDPQRWAQAVTLPNAPAQLPADQPCEGHFCAGEAAFVRTAFSRDDTTGMLVDAATSWRVQAPDVLLTALTTALNAWTGSSSALIDIENHGRENVSADVDVLRTVGWFTSLCPVALSVDSNAPASDQVRDVKDALRALPDRGLAYGAIRYLSSDADVRKTLADEPQPQIQFNYLGQWDRARAGGHYFTFTRPISLSEDRDMPREHALAVDAIVYDGKLDVTWTFDPKRFNRKTIETLAQNFAAALRTIIESVRRGDAAALAPSDFPTAGLDQTDLDDLLSDFGEAP
ncbi:MAG: amino acid adenylation domain-containing protein [Gammaproteobacteria bacterium]